MRNLIALTFLLISISTMAQKAATAIRANFAEQERSWSAHDLEAYVKAYHPSEKTKTISRLGVTYGVDNILKDYQKYYNDDNMGRLFFDEITIEKVSSKYYYVTGRFNLDYGKERTMRQGYFSGLMKKHKGKWLIIADHSS